MLQEESRLEAVSEYVQDNIAFGMSVEGLISAEQEEYIYLHGLYRNPRYEAIKSDLSTKLSPKRFQHVLGVARTAVLLARANNFDAHTAYLAGLLHDCAKYLSDEDMLKAASDNNIELEDIEKRAVQLVHAKVGAFYAQSIYGVNDEDILNSIKYHTTGRPGMSMLEKIIYISDFIEPGRNFDEELLAKLRSEALSNIDDALYDILEHTYSYLKEKYSDNISGITEETYFYYKKIKESGENYEA